MAKIGLAVCPESSVLSICPCKGWDKDRNILYPWGDNQAQQCLAQVEANPGQGLCVWSSSSTKCRTLMTFPHLSDPTPWLPSQSFCP